MATRRAFLGLTLAALLALPVLFAPRTELFAPRASAWRLRSAVLAQQSAPPQRIRGEIAKVEGEWITIKTRSGEMVTIMMTDKTGVAGVTKTDFSEVATGKFVGIASQPQPDGSLKALEVVVFPETMRGRAEGHYAWDLTSGSMMTNANVAAAVESKNGRELTLTPKDHASVKIVVPENVPVVTFVPSDKSKIVPGAKVFVIAVKTTDGALMSPFVAVGVDVAPPM